MSGFAIELERCETKVAELQALINSLDSDDLSGQIDELEISIVRDRKTVMEIDASLSGLVEPLKSLEVQLEGSSKDL